MHLKKMGLLAAIAVLFSLFPAIARAQWVDMGGTFTPDIQDESGSGSYDDLESGSSFFLSASGGNTAAYAEYSGTFTQFFNWTGTGTSPALTVTATIYLARSAVRYARSWPLPFITRAFS